MQGRKDTLVKPAPVNSIAYCFGPTPTGTSDWRHAHQDGTIWPTAREGDRGTIDQCLGPTGACRKRLDCLSQSTQEDHCAFLFCAYFYPLFQNKHSLNGHLLLCFLLEIVCAERCLWWWWLGFVNLSTGSSSPHYTTRREGFLFCFSFL
jgi:hypothetical protein